jgi:hypothetical protein
MTKQNNNQSKKKPDNSGVSFKLGDRARFLPKK